MKKMPLACIFLLLPMSAPVLASETAQVPKTFYSLDAARKAAEPNKAKFSPPPKFLPLRTQKTFFLPGRAARSASTETAHAQAAPGSQPSSSGMSKETAQQLLSIWNPTD